MNILILLAHPRNASLNHSLAQRLVKLLKTEGHQLFFHDLYAEKFDPVLKANELLDTNYFSPDLELYCHELKTAECIIIIHPNWWGQPPAILKGWIDRVVRLGVGYGFDDKGEGVPVRLLDLRLFFVFNTSNTPTEREESVFHDPLQYIWKNCIADFLGAKDFHRSMFSVVVTSTHEEREKWIEDSCELVSGSLRKV